MKVQESVSDLRSGDAIHDIGSPEKLRERFREDGFLYFSTLLEPEDVRAVRNTILKRLYEVGWLRTDTPPEAARPGAASHHDNGRIDGCEVVDPGWSEGYRAVQSIETLHGLAHHPAVRKVVRALLGSDLVVHPRKIVRIAFPDPTFSTPPHQDWLFNAPTVDVVTAWIPLGWTPAHHGALKLVPGSAPAGPRKVVPADGLGGEAAEVDGKPWEWLTTDFELGDVVLFHGLTVHSAGPNLGDCLRLSVDARYQSATEPIRAVALLPHHYAQGVLPGWSTLTRGWTSKAAIDVEQPVRIAALESPEGPQSSRLVPWASQ